MRIAIISHHRSGSTTISEWLSLELGYEWINEPFNVLNDDWKIRHQNSLIMDKVLVKFIHNHFINENQIDEIIDTFDKVITLTRNNVRDCAISAVHANEVKNCHDKYRLSEGWLDKNEDEINDEIDKISYNNGVIKNIKPALHITYEGIFDTKEDIVKLKDYLKLGNLQYTDLIDKKNRYQITGDMILETTIDITPSTPNNTNKKSLI